MALRTHASPFVVAAKVTRHLGSDAFWPALIHLLQRWVPFDNALVAWYLPEQVPRIVLEHDQVQPVPDSLVGRYLDGMFRLDPFYQAFLKGLQPGLHRLIDVAPDRFRHSDYYAHYFRHAVGQDELQLVCRQGTAVLSVSMGSQIRYGRGISHSLTQWLPMLLALVDQQGRLIGPPAKGVTEEGQPPQPAAPIRDALARFGLGALSRREAEVARLILQGHSLKSMEDELGISDETIRTYRRHVFNKLNVRKASELFRLFASSVRSVD